MWEYGEEHVDHDWVNFFAAFLRFIKEPYIEHRAIVPSRHARKRADRNQVDRNSVHVVHLRKADHKSTPPAGGTIEYSHRFMVKGHWRNQWYPSIQAHRPRYIMPFIKGPDDKPLVIRDTAFLVDR